MVVTSTSSYSFPSPSLAYSGVTVKPSVIDSVKFFSIHGTISLFLGNPWSCDHDLWLIHQWVPFILKFQDAFITDLQSPWLSGSKRSTFLNAMNSSGQVPGWSVDHSVRFGGISQGGWSVGCINPGVPMSSPLQFLASCGFYPGSPKRGVPIG